MNAVIGRNWRDAASLIVLCKNNREASRYNYKVLLQTRTQGASFKNAVVFPGGVTEASDSDHEWMKLFKSFGFTQKDFEALHHKKSQNLLLFQNNPVQRHISLRITAIRETFEELGLLICSRKRKSERSDSWGSVLSDIDVKYWQKKISNNPEELLNLCKEVHGYPDIWSLHYWSNWLTPALIKKRFDTAFFLVALDSEPPYIEGNTEVAKVEMWKFVCLLLNNAKTTERIWMNFGTQIAYELDYILPREKPHSHGKLDEACEAPGQKLVFHNIFTFWSNPSEVLEKNEKLQLILYPPQSYELNRIGAWTNIKDITKSAQEGTSFCNDILFYHVTVQAKDGYIFVFPGDDLYPSNVDYNKSRVIDIEKTISDLRKDSNKAHRFEVKTGSQTNLVLKNLSFNNTNMAETVIPCYLTMSG